MVKFHTSAHSYDYSLSAVSLAYFLRYPNPYSTHVLTEDVIDRYFDADSQKLYTTRLHLKKSKMPPWLMKMLPRNILGGCKGQNGEAQNFILERSIVDIKAGWMETETQNLQLANVVKVIETQRYDRSFTIEEEAKDSTTRREKTDVVTTVTLRSRFGEMIRKGERSDGQERQGLLAWSTQRLRRAIEEKTLEKTRIGLINSKEGMGVVLGRLRQGGLSAVLEGMRQDRLLVLAGVPGRGAHLHESSPRWKSLWKNNNDSGEGGFDL
ncbi:MAG: hypothetical protein GOMPHAMPRED_001262 [Gomphillus americanus]|uniref:PRELI/MSF1 domain-containing protein n=1 Tax=Gomphillus americanus TaxID=1940652 RepID=A0A8H3F2W8_9LECA|nr:MAG: hypothetical protein GOMPHAMPRED_001262 [Gomphillus americanus]